MIEFTIGEHEYRAEKLTLFQQNHVSRRLAPIVPKLIPVLMQLAGASSEARRVGASFTDYLLANVSTFLPSTEPLLEAFATLKDEDAEYVIATCLMHVKRKIAEGQWSAVWAQGARAPMFDDLNDSMTALPLVWKVVQHSLGSFIPGFRTAAGNPQERSGS